MAIRAISRKVCGKKYSVVLGLLAIGLSFSTAMGASSKVTPATRAQYNAKVSARYDYRFGAGKPFLPSNATTDNGQFIQPGAFPTAKYCGHCHEATYHQWRQSLHANSFREPFYLNNANLLNHTQGIEYSRHCEGCHNPIALFSGALTSHPVMKKRPFDQDGVTCSVCHSIEKLQPSYGTGAYVMGVPAVMVDADGKPIAGEVPYQEILNHTDRHKQAVMKDFYRTPEYCGACHEAALPKQLNHYKWLLAINLYQEWQASSYSHRSPLPFYSKPYSTCETCHMPQVAAETKDYSAKGGMIASHRWIAGNTAVPFYYKYKEQLEKTEAFLQDDKLNVDIFALRRNGNPQFIAPLGNVSYELNPGDTVETDVVIQNKGIGHSLIPEQRDIFQAWVEFTVKDAAGHVLGQSGNLEPSGHLDPTAHSFVARMLQQTGKLQQGHQVWLRRINVTDNTVQSGRSTLVRYEFHIPADAKGPLTVTASVRYRHLNETFTNISIGDRHPPYPVVQMASSTRTLQLGKNGPSQPLAGQNPDWMRWNNFGIALLDEQQYNLSAYAFHQVAALRPDYADAHTNLGVAYSKWEQYDKAGAELKKALEMSPGNSRALYYQALVERNQGDVNAAISNLQAVVREYPRSPDARRELGFSYYQQHQYELAEAQYRALEGINPNDLSAHYILAIVYRRLGNRDLAKKESALFADEKNDPMASSASLMFLEKHPQLSGESIPWHLHSTAGSAVALHPAGAE